MNLHLFAYSSLSTISQFKSVLKTFLIFLMSKDLFRHQS